MMVMGWLWLDIRYERRGKIGYEAIEAIVLGSAFVS
jgi:hypothetical protein